MSSAITSAKFNSLSVADQNLLSGIAEASGYNIGGPSPLAVAAGQQVGNIAGSGVAFTGSNSNNGN